MSKQRSELYKASGLKGPNVIKERQNIRRIQALELQQKRKWDLTALARRLTTTENDNSDENDLSAGSEDDHKYKKDSSNSTDQAMEIEGSSKNSGGKRKRKYVLMIPEQIEEMPNQLHDMWLAIACPEGQRCIVTSSNGSTVCCDPFGNLLFRFSTLLPAGYPTTSRPRDHCILDCVYITSSKTFYVIDMMSWGGHPIYDCTAEFRIEFWKTSRLSELASEVDRVKNVAPKLATEYRFLPAPTVRCQNHMLATLINSNPSELFEVGNNNTNNSESRNIPRLDGLLLLHCEARYIPGISPLSCWIPQSALGQLIHKA
ncbi:hypothetical protein H4219_000566 [Mycoemilia scoparia]|uniref:Snurportin-1 n=1 Tax=Mycoemilia scoparia TaxID=417184 RepID=A0A9W8DSW2_9FUNG|nr:hypothetical protein H4219_000566 [Mycoemilia scoparia]